MNEAGESEEKSSEQAPRQRRRRGRSNGGGEAKGSSGAGEFEGKAVPELPGEPGILSRSDHCISRKNIDEDALKVLRRLLRHGHKAFLVGGGVRDLLLGKQPKDFDISTDATPENVRTLFRNSRIIGRRFKINHVYFRGGKIIEVATFRQSSADDPSEGVQTLTSDNTYGTPQTDAVRRDLTINGLFYDLSSFSVIDYVGGIQDLNDGIIRIIGEPVQRIREDPVRMIRAVRHAARANFKIEEETYSAICAEKETITLCPSARVYEEFVRELRGGNSLGSFELLDTTGLLPHLLPLLGQSLEEHREGTWERLRAVLSEIDKRTKQSSAELPVAVLMPAILIGNLPASLLRQAGEDPKLDSLYDYWADTPAAMHQSDSEEERVLPKLPGRGEPAAARGRRRRAGVTRLGKLIGELFESVGVSRKDRERIEQLITARYLMLAGIDADSAAQLSRRPYFDEALLLLQLTAHDEKSRAITAQWSERGSSGSSNPKRRNRKRGRRRSNNKEQTPSHD